MRISRLSLPLVGLFLVAGCPDTKAPPAAQPKEAAKSKEAAKPAAPAVKLAPAPAIPASPPFLPKIEDPADNPITPEKVWHLLNP